MPEIKPTADDVTAALHLRAALERLKAAKPNDRSDRDRYYAIAITDMEKLYAYFSTWVINGGK